MVLGQRTMWEGFSALLVGVEERWGTPGMVSRSRLRAGGFGHLLVRGEKN